MRCEMELKRNNIDNDNNKQFICTPLSMRHDSEAKYPVIRDDL